VKEETGERMFVFTLFEEVTPFREPLLMPLEEVDGIKNCFDIDKTLSTYIWQ
jgi:hypothetical protein